MLQGYYHVLDYRQKESDSAGQKLHIMMAVLGHVIQVQALLFLSASGNRECVNWNYLILPLNYSCLIKAFWLDF